MKKLRQDYAAYTSEDQKVWSLLFNRQASILSKFGSAAFLEAIEEVNFHDGKIPVFKEVDAILLSTTGWQLEVVPGHIPPKDFFELLSQKKFPATAWLRKMNQLEYIEEPDMFHDVFGHVPLLVHEDYSNFLTGMAKIALKAMDHGQMIELLSRMYWFTIEFGLIREKQGLKIYGAGILSSHGESAFSMSGKPDYRDFDVKTILETSFRTDAMQEQYFVIESLSQLYHSLNEVEEWIERKILSPLRETLG